MGCDAGGVGYVWWVVFDAVDVVVVGLDGVGSAVGAGFVGGVFRHDGFSGLGRASVG